MTDYAKMKNAELEALLKQRNLPHGGKKADMVARLQEDDGKTEQTPNAPATTKQAVAEDEIDWDDEEPAKAPLDAPVSEAPAPAVATTTIETKSTEPATDKDAAAGAPEAETIPAVDFSIGLADSTIDEEIEKRKARAKKFGTEMEPEAEEALRKLERAKKFGEAGGPRGLNEALPERQKRRREDGDNRRDFKRRGGGHGGPGGPRFNGNRGRGSGAPSGAQPSRVEKRTGNHPSWMTDADRAAAERRKSKFASSGQ